MQPALPQAIVRFNLRETEDVVGDIECLRQIREVIEEFRPGCNRIMVTIITLDGQRTEIQWRAIAARELRMGIARALAHRASASHEGGRHGNRRRA
jgi:hypothetical protein